MKKFYLMMNPKIIETEFAGHARELAHQLDLDDFDGMIVIGGDGTIHEVVNGLLTRPDKKKLPIGLIPGGSGKSLMVDWCLVNPQDAANAIVSGHVRKVNVAEVKIEESKRVRSLSRRSGNRKSG